MLERLFRLRDNKTSVRTEIVAGVTTFMTMAYILAVNPDILSASGMPKGGVFVATALAAVVGTLFMAFFSNYPFVLAAGMGLNAYFAFSVCGDMGYSWQFALLAVFVEGLVFLVLSLTSVRESIFNAIPVSLKKAVAAGIGLFITLIALKNAGILISDDNTYIKLVSFSTVPFHTTCIVALMALVGIVVTGVLHARRFKAAILLGILATWVLGIVAEETGLYRPDTDGDGISDETELAWGLNPFEEQGKLEDAAKDLDGDGYSNLAEFVFGTDAKDPESFPTSVDADGNKTPVPEDKIVAKDAKFSPHYSTIPSFKKGYWNELGQTFGAFGRTFGALFDPSAWTHKTKTVADDACETGGQAVEGEATENVDVKGWKLLLSLNFFVVMFAFFFVDLFDTLGTLIGVSLKGGFLDKQGRLPRISGALYADSVATTVGAVFGTSTTTTFVESAAGVAAGGKTGLAGVTAAGLFLVSLLLAPLFLAIPGFATTPALVVVGYMMINSIGGIDFEDPCEGLPAFLAIVAMPFFYSISDGIMFGVISYTVVNLCAGKARRISPVMYVLTVLFLAKYALM